MIFQDKEQDYNKLNEKKNHGSRALEQRKSEAEAKKVVSSNMAKEEKKDIQKIENYYYFNQNGSPKVSRAVPSSPTAKPLDQVKSVDSVLSQKKNEKVVRIE